MKHNVTVVGAGLAGSEAAWQLARRGVHVTLREMKPAEMTPAHHSADFAELVCSNSLRGAGLATAPGLLKEELRRCGSLIMEAADATAVPAGGALAVDREGFSAYVTEKLRTHPNVEILPGRVDDIPAGPCIMATGPLTEGVLARRIDELFGGEPMHFYDAAAPIVSFESIDMDHAYFASRYDKGTADYINCPLDREQYTAFVEALRTAKEAPVHGFEDKAVFEGCMPVEVMARRGEDTLRFGPMKPVGLKDPRTGERPYAVLQLRADNAEKTAFNLVGFQTHLMHPEQKRVFGMIPALAHAEYYRYGTMHRNSFIRSPGRLDRYYRVIGREELYFAGQITGVEGYIESTASGLCCGLNLFRQLEGLDLIAFPRETALGALMLHISEHPEERFDPMNINFGIITSWPERIRNKQERYTAISHRALDILGTMEGEIKEGLEA